MQRVELKNVKFIDLTPNFTCIGDPKAYFPPSNAIARRPRGAWTYTKTRYHEVSPGIAISFGKSIERLVHKKQDPSGSTLVRENEDALCVPPIGGEY